MGEKLAWSAPTAREEVPGLLRQYSERSSPVITKNGLASVLLTGDDHLSPIPLPLSRCGSEVPAP